MLGFIDIIYNIELEIEYTIILQVVLFYDSQSRKAAEEADKLN